MEIARERICLDAGFGFGKSLDENLEILRRGRELKNFEYENFRFPILSATSRKSTIGKILGDLPPEERVFGTAAATAIAIQNGADIIRVHDVKEMAQVARVCDAATR
jgi:dihydropteroate synthase